jgi:hypothetical protein
MHGEGGLVVHIDVVDEEDRIWRISPPKRRGWNRAFLNVAGGYAPGLKGGQEAHGSMESSSVRTVMGALHAAPRKCLKSCVPDSTSHAACVRPHPPVRQRERGGQQGGKGAGGGDGAQSQAGAAARRRLDVYSAIRRSMHGRRRFVSAVSG